jgi:hypothetical protein
MPFNSVNKNNSVSINLYQRIRYSLPVSNRVYQGLLKFASLIGFTMVHWGSSQSHGVY